MKTDNKIIKYSELIKIREKLKKEGKVSILTTGCFDLLHLGHVIHFNFCKSQGDVLIVSIGNDETVRLLKGPTRPINNQTFRARMVAALECVDLVVISEEVGKMDHNKLVELLRPNIYVVPAADSAVDEKQVIIKKYGGKLIKCKRLPPGHLKGGISTTKIEKKLKNEK